MYFHNRDEEAATNLNSWNLSFLKTKVKWSASFHDLENEILSPNHHRNHPNRRWNRHIAPGFSGLHRTKKLKKHIH